MSHLIRVRHALVSFLMLAVAASERGSAQSRTPLPTAALNAHFANLGRFGVSGAVVVSRGNRVVYETAFGWADRAKKLPMTTNTGVDIASMSKDLTTVAVLRLAERGLLTLQDSLAQLLDAVPADKRAITIEQLLTHRSGLPQFFVEGNDFQMVTRDSALSAILNAPLEFKPGTGSEYSDAGYVLLAILSERLSRLPFEALLQRDQFTPARLARTFSYGTQRLREASSIAHGYLGEHDAGSPTSYVKDSSYWVIKGAGGIVSSARDIASWEIALANGTLLSQASMERLFGADSAGAVRSLAGPLTTFGSGRQGRTRTGTQDFGFSSGVLRFVRDSTVIVLTLNRQIDSLDIAYLRTQLLRDLDGFLAGTMRPSAPGSRPIASNLSRAVVGDYRLADSSTIRLTPTADGLRLTPDGPLAVELLGYGADTVGRAARLDLARRTADIFQRLCIGDLAPLRAAFRSPSERLENYLRTTACAEGARVRVVGSVPRWWTSTPLRSPATLVRVTRPSGKSLFRLEWENNQIVAVGGGGILAPSMPVRASSVAGELVGYNPFLRLTMRIAPLGSNSLADQVELRTAAGERVSARRVH